MEKTFKKLVFRGCAIIIAIIMIFIAIVEFSFIKCVKNGNEPSLFGYTPTIVITGSMVPTIEINTLNIYKECIAEDVEIGDIVVFWSDEHQIDIIHRAIEIKEINGVTHIVTQGDANEYPDKGYVTNNNIRGKVIRTFNNSVDFVNGIMKYDNSGVDNVKVGLYLFAGAMVIWVILTAAYAMTVGIMFVIDAIRNNKINWKR